MTTYNPPNYQNNPAAAIPVYITSGSNQTPYQFTPLGYVQITNLSSAVGLGSIPTGATVAFLSCEGSELRYRDDGTAPTTAVGMPLYAGQTMEYSGTLSAIQFIQASSGGILNVAYYK